MEKPETDGWAKSPAEIFASKTKKSWPRILLRAVPVFLHLRSKQVSECINNYNFLQQGNKHVSKTYLLLALFISKATGINNSSDPWVWGLWLYLIPVTGLPKISVQRSVKSRTATMQGDSCSYWLRNVCPERAATNSPAIPAALKVTSSFSSCLRRSSASKASFTWISWAISQSCRSLEGKKIGIIGSWSHRHQSAWRKG